MNLAPPNLGHESNYPDKSWFNRACRSIPCTWNGRFNRCCCTRSVRPFFLDLPTWKVVPGISHGHVTALFPARKVENGSVLTPSLSPFFLYDCNCLILHWALARRSLWHFCAATKERETREEKDDLVEDQFRPGRRKTYSTIFEFQTNPLLYRSPLSRNSTKVRFNKRPIKAGAIWNNGYILSRRFYESDIALRSYGRIRYFIRWTGFMRHPNVYRRARY